LSRSREVSLLPTRGILALVIFFSFVLLLTFLFGDRGIMEILKTQRQIRRLEQAIRTLEAEKEALQREVAQLRSNPQAVEAQAREKLWLMKGDEKLIVIDPEKGKKEAKKNE
jgi:cell division protein FtsB